MAWHYIYRVSNGELVSEASVEPVGLDSSMAFITETNRRGRRVWDPGTHTFGPVIPKPTSDQEITEILDRVHARKPMNTAERDDLEFTLLGLQEVGLI